MFLPDFPRPANTALPSPAHTQMASMLEGGGKTPILTPQQLEAMGYKLCAYPLSLLGVSVAAMQAALVGLKAGAVPQPPAMPTFQVAELCCLHRVVHVRCLALHPVQLLPLRRSCSSATRCCCRLRPSQELQALLGFSEYFAEADRYAAVAAAIDGSGSGVVFGGGSGSGGPATKAPAAESPPAPAATARADGSSGGGSIDADAVLEPGSGSSSSSSGTSEALPTGTIDLYSGAGSSGGGGGAGQEGQQQQQQYGARDRRDAQWLRVRVSNARSGVTTLDTRFPAGVCCAVLMLCCADAADAARLADCQPAVVCCAECDVLASTLHKSL